MSILLVFVVLIALIITFVVKGVSVVGCYQNISACGGSSLTSAHQNLGTALSLKSKAGMSSQLTTGRKPGGSQCRRPGRRGSRRIEKPTDSTRRW